MSDGRIRAVVFDFGGVIAEEGFREGLYEIARRYGKDPVAFHRAAMDAIYESGYITGKGNVEGFWRLLQKKTGIACELVELLSAIASRFALRPSMLELVRSLRSKGYITAILSDQTEWLEHLDREFHFFQEFDRVYNSYRLGKGKRDPSVFADVAGDLGIAAAEMVFIDDDPGNIERAIAQGAKGIVFKDEQQCKRDLEAILGE